MLVFGFGLLDATSFAQEPEPFRGDDGEIDGRDFRYGSDGFLQRFSFDFQPVLDRAWPVAEEGFRGTAGSISSGEFYSEQHFRWRPRLDEDWFFDLRYRRQEDFDSRYDRILTGLGRRWGESGWSSTILANVVAEKPGIDTQFETAWSSARGDRARFGLVLVDLPHDKSDEFEYDEQPLTLFAEGGAWLADSLWVDAWTNLNLPLRRTELDDGFDFTYEQYTAGLDWTYHHADGWSVGQSFEGLFGQRSRRTFDGDLTEEQRFSRRHWTSRLWFRRDLSPDVTLDCGLRRFALDERDRRPFASDDARDLVRREWILDVAVSWRYSRRATFAPHLFIAATDNEEQAPYDPMGIDDRDEDFLAKINLPLVIHFDRGLLSLNPSFTLHEPSFGGGNVQIQIPF